jgi:hypothetical protein
VSWLTGAERACTCDERCAAILDDLEGEPRLRRIHGEDGEVVDGQEVGADVAAKGAVERAVDLCPVKIGSMRGGEMKTTRLCAWQARTVCEGARQKSLSSAGDADEKGIGSVGEATEVVKRQVSGAQLLARRIEVEVEGAPCSLGNR